MNWRQINSAAVDSQLDGEAIASEFAESFPVLAENKVRKNILDEAAQCADNVRRRLILDDPYTADNARLMESEREFASGVYDAPAIRKDLDAFGKLAKKAGEYSGKEMDIWSKSIDKIDKAASIAELSGKFSSPGVRKRKDAEKAGNDRRILRSRLLKKWHKVLDKAQSEWELNAIAEYRRGLMEKLREWLEMLQQFADILKGLGFYTGLLVDLSKGNLSLGDIEQMRRWAEYIAKDDHVKKLCDMLGRLRVAEKTKQKEMAKRISYVDAFVPDIDSKEEIVGVRIGREIEYALPQEKALLADEETSLLFDLKFAEGRLMCFDMEGLSVGGEKTQERVMIEKEQAEKMGPVIICVDTSGSMNGMPETIAKAVALFMATRALAQKRDCMLINFSTNIKTLDLSGETGVGEVVRFLRMSFHGGTDVAPALNHAVDVMKKENYKKSDLLIVSDFVMGDVPDNIRQTISAAKSDGNKFYSLCVGDDVFPSRLRDIFDGEWVYNPQTGGIVALHEALHNIGDSR